MKRLFLLYLLVFCCNNATYAQEHRRNDFSLQLGMAHLSRQDLIFSPMVHQTVGLLNIGLEYHREARFYQLIGVRYAGFSPQLTAPYTFYTGQSSNTTAPHSLNMVELNYVLAYPLKRTAKFSLEAGGVVQSKIQALAYVYGRISSFGYYAANGVGLSARGVYKAGEKNKLELLLQLPVLAWLARSPYLVNDDEFIQNISSHNGVKTFGAYLADGSLKGIHQWQSLDLQVSYNRFLSKHWSLGLSYRHAFIRYAEPRLLTSFTNTLSFTTTYQF